LPDFKEKRLKISKFSRGMFLASFLAVAVAGCGGGGGGGTTGGAGGGGASIDTEACRDYTPVVTVTSVSPNRGPVAGGTEVTVRGSGFSKCSPSVPLVAVGNAGSAQVKSYTDTEIVFITPNDLRPRTQNIMIGVTNPVAFNPNKPPFFEGVSVTNAPSAIAQFTYE
jgi:hypothetical protein